MKKLKNGVFGTNEWSVKSSNIQIGCGNICTYCFAREISARFKKRCADKWNEEDINLAKVNMKFKKLDGRIMFPSTHDINNTNVEYAIIHLKNILKVGNEVLIVSKPRIEVITRLCAELYEFRDKILFRFSIGSTSSDTLYFWEPGATDYEERKQCLIYAFEHGFSTSVSAEPLLDTSAIELVDDLLPYISDAIWIGKANSLIRRLKINGVYDAEMMNRTNELLSSQSDDFFKNLYIQLQDNPKVKWKESIKKIVGLKISTTAGLDI